MNKVFIAASLDGYIADADGRIDWLEMISNPDQLDMGYDGFIQSVDAIVMGKKTFETVLGFDIPWPYSLPVFVASRTLSILPNGLEKKVNLVQGSPTEIVELIHKKGFHHIYIDGGNVIHQFLEADLIDELTITRFPILLGKGVPLFAELDNKRIFELVNSRVYLNHLVQSTYRRKIT